MQIYRFRSFTFFIVFVLFIAGCIAKEHCDVIPDNDSLEKSLFVFKDKLKNEKAKRILSEASEDFDLVLAGKNPRNAKPDSALIKGITKFNGNGYTLQIVDTDGTVADVYVHIYGPIIEFSDADFQLLEKKISAVKLYDQDKYLSLKGKK